MTELKCPHCGQVFTVDENELDSIVNQIRDVSYFCTKKVFCPEKPPLPFSL